jgi:hypothetical protein
MDEFEDNDDTVDEPEELHAGSRDARGRFMNGAPSANPHGAPKKRLKPGNITKMMDPTATMVVRLAGMPAAKRADGTIVTRFERALEELYLRGTDPKKPNMAALKEYVRITAEGLAADKKWQNELLSYALEHKALWSEKFETAERLGRRVPKIFPHPQDIVILNDGVAMVGPMDMEEHKQMLAALQMRDIYLRALETITEKSLLDDPIWTAEIGRMKREVRKLNNALPPRLRAETLPQKAVEEPEMPRTAL